MKTIFQNQLFIPAAIYLTCFLVLACALIHTAKVNRLSAIIHQGAVGNGIQTNFVVIQ